MRLNLRRTAGLLSGILLLVSAGFQVFASGFLAGFGLDSMVGYSTILRSSQIEAGVEVVFEVRDPAGKVLSVPSKTRTNGVAIETLSGENLRLPGEYLVSAHRKGEAANFGNANAFEVFGEDGVTLEKEPQRFKVAANGNFGALAEFMFDDVPASVRPGETVTLTLKAVDSLEQTVTNYLGEVRFFVEGANADYVVLPEDYEFEAEDLGEHTFTLAFTFQRAGTYLLKVVDLENVNIKGEQQIVVVSGNGTLDNGAFVLTSPTDGIYSGGNQVVRGRAPAGAQVKIFDNDVEIGSVIADASGNFAFTANLAGGEHVLYAAQVNGSGIIVAVSNVATIGIDMESAKIVSAEVSPAEIMPLSAVTVRMRADGDLSRAFMIVDGKQIDLTRGSNGSYDGAFAAPVGFGDYPIDFVLVDLLGNESRFEDFKTFKVGVEPATLGSGTLAAVTNLKAQGVDGRVLLTWDAVKGANVVGYRVYYGIAPDLLTEAVDTLNTKPTWYVPNLLNGSTYYFAVVALDASGNMSGVYSNIATAVAGGGAQVGNPDLSSVIGGNDEARDALNDLDKDVSESGPEILWLILLSVVAGNFYVVSRRKRREGREQ